MSLIPQALTISIPIGLTVGVVLGLARRPVSTRLAAVVAAAAAVISIGSIANVGWILPNANQAFRVAIFERSARQDGRQVLSREPDRGEPELTFGELTEQMDRYAASPLGSREWSRARSLRLHYHTRWSVAFASFVLTLFSMSLAAVTRRRWVLGVGAIAAIIGYYIVLYFGRGLVLQGELSPPVAAWLANVITLVVSALLVIRHRSRLRAELIGERQAFHA